MYLSSVRQTNALNLFTHSERTENVSAATAQVSRPGESVMSSQTTHQLQLNNHELHVLHIYGNKYFPISPF